ncbi:MAG: threonine synthase [Saprospiraceae bacterium]|jgi:threonine synthase|nr:threonine synthase [Saprospiraceae bacterium]
MTGSLFSTLTCTQCLSEFSIHETHSFCQHCNQPLVASYELTKCTTEQIIDFSISSMWRYKRVLPVLNEKNIVSLGEGNTPLLPLIKSSSFWGVRNLWLKEEAGNPTGSFKARGMSMAVSKAREWGISAFCAPTAGNAGSALAAYAAATGAEAHIYMPMATPEAFRMDCTVMGARVVEVDGSIRDAGIAMQKENADGKWWDISTLKEPFRLEGKKTLGYELAEQLGWCLPDVILYPTGGGTGLIGIWKAFREMQQMGWITEIPTRMIAIQTQGCRPVVDAFEAGADHCKLFESPAETIANGLRVPKPFGDKMIMKVLHESHGAALAVSEKDMLESMRAFAGREGIFLSPEGAALAAAVPMLKDKNLIYDSDRIVLINTGSPYKYLENLT